MAKKNDKNNKYRIELRHILINCVVVCSSFFFSAALTSGDSLLKKMSCYISVFFFSVFITFFFPFAKENEKLKRKVPVAVSLVLTIIAAVFLLKSKYGFLIQDFKFATVRDKPFVDAFFSCPFIFAILNSVLRLILKYIPDFFKESINAVKKTFSEFKTGKFTIAFLSTVIGCIIIGAVLLFCSYAVPNDKIAANIEESSMSERFYDKSGYLIEDIPSTRLENYMDGLMMAAVAYDSGESVFNQAMKNCYFCTETDGANDFEKTINEFTVNGSKEEYKVVNYGRYWHGYMIVLKPLFALFNYSQIRSVNLVVQIAALIVIAILLKRRSLTEYMPVFIACLISVGFFMFPLSFQFSWVYYITVFSVIMQLAFIKKMQKREIKYIFFTFVGAMTAYFDLLTFPLITLCVPLLIFAVSEKRENEQEHTCNNVFIPSIFWVLGYTIMWSGKWIVYRIVTGESILKNALFAIANRVLYADESSALFDSEIKLGHYNFLDIITRNCEVYISSFTVIGVIIVLTVLIVKAKKGRVMPENNNLSYFTISLFPVLWYMVFNNHSYVHSRYTFRIIMIPVLSVGFMITESIGKEAKIKKK